MNHQKDIRSVSENIFDGRYYIINKRLLQLIGQWPYQCDKERFIKFWGIMLTGCTGLGPQLRCLIITWGKLDAFVSCFTPLLTNIGCISLIINSHFRIQQVKKLLDDTLMNWNNMNNLPHIKILNRHAETGRSFTIMYCTVVYIAVAGWLFTPLLPKILDVVAPLNHSRKNLEVFPTDHGVDRDKYFWPIFLNLGGGLIIGSSAIAAIDSFYMSLAQHACGMFEILRKDLENVLPEKNIMMSVDLHPNYYSDVTYQHIVSFMKRHKNIVQYVSDMQVTCEWSLFFMVGISVIVLSMTTYQTVAESTPQEEVVRMALFSIAQTFHLYCITLPGHWISQESSYLPISVYSCKWYMMSIRSRKLLVLFTRASIQPCTITAGKIYVMSIENFRCVLQTSLSYLTMLTSTQ